MEEESEPAKEAKAIRTHDKRTRKIYQIGAILIAVAMISSALTLVAFGDPPASAPDTFIDWEGLEAYKINGIRYAIDGTTDAIQDAVDDLPAAGGLIIVPNGEYTWTSSYTVTRSNFAILFSPSTVIIQSGEAHGFDISSKENITIANCHIEGLRSIKTLEKSAINIVSSNQIRVMDCVITSWYGTGVYATYCSDVKVDRIKTLDWPVGIRFDSIVFAGSNESTASDNVLASSITVGSSSHNVILKNNNLTGNAGTHGGLYCAQGSNNVTFVGNQISSFEHSAIECRGSNVTIFGNTLFDNTNGIEVFADLTTEFPKDIVISSNVIHSNDGEGIKVYKSATNFAPTRVIISNNIISGNGADGVELSSYHVTNISVIGNIISHNAESGILSFALNSIISNNNLEYCAAPAIRVNANTTVSHNLIKNITSSGGYAIFVPTTVCDVSIIGNVVLQAWGNGKGVYLFGDNKRIVVSENLISNMTGSDAYGISVGSNCESIVISSNSVHYVGGAALSVATSTLVTAIGNDFSLNNKYGILLNHVTYSTFISNIVNGNSRNAVNGYSGMIVLGTSHNISFIGNVAIDLEDTVKQKHGLESTGTVDYLIVIGNIFSPNYNTNYSIVGSNNIVYGNL